MYLQLLKNAINPTLLDIIENDQQYGDHIIFQREGALPHYVKR